MRNQLPLRVSVTATTSRTVRGWWRCSERVLNLAVPEIVLNQAGVSTLIGEGKAAGTAQHVGINGHR